MITPITIETFKAMGFNAGALFKNIDYSAATNAATLAAIFRPLITARTGLIGATKGGINIIDTPDVFLPELDGLTIPVKGSRRINGREIKVTGTEVELTADNYKDLIAAADTSTSGSVDTITPRIDFADSDYIDHLVWIGDCGDGYVLAEFDNVLNVVGLNQTNPSKDTATNPFEFVAHMSDPQSDVVPYRILKFHATGTTAAPSIALYSVEGADTGKTRLSVTPQVAAGQSYKYKTSATVALPSAGDVLTTGWTAWDGDADVTATTGDQIVVAIITTSTNACVRAGRATVKSKA